MPYDSSLLNGCARDKVGAIIALKYLEFRQHLRAEEIEVLSARMSHLRGSGEFAVELTDRLNFLTALRIHGLLQVGTPVESRMGFGMAGAAEGGAVSGLKASLRQETLPANVVSGNPFGRVTDNAAMPIACANEVAPAAKAKRFRCSSRSGFLEPYEKAVGR